MKAQFARDISTELEKKGLCADVALYIEEICIKNEFEKFKLELMDAAYKFVTRKCDYFYDNDNDRNYLDAFVSESKYWLWTKYREVCFPNELGCTCCLAGYPGVFCKKEWCKNQNCACDQNVQNYACICDSPYRRHYETSQNCRDINQPDYEYFKIQIS
tara:strand:- start:85 stop:561 length:477 start_codon:yes stop_codon:yes gene_type:complete